MNFTWSWYEKHAKSRDFHVKSIFGHFVISLDDNFREIPCSSDGPRPALLFQGLAVDEADQLPLHGPRQLLVVGGPQQNRQLLHEPHRGRVQSLVALITDLKGGDSKVKCTLEQR